MRSYRETSLHVPYAETRCPKCVKLKILFKKTSEPTSHCRSGGRTIFIFKKLYKKNFFSLMLRPAVVVVWQKKRERFKLFPAVWASKFRLLSGLKNR